jgi:hypothetical protein
MSNLASVPYAERMTLALSNGKTGLALLRDYGLRTGELLYFVNFVKNSLAKDSQIGGLSPTLMTESLKSSIASLVEEISEEITSVEGEPGKNEIEILSGKVEQLINIFQKAAGISYSRAT